MRSRLDSDVLFGVQIAIRTVKSLWTAAEITRAGPRAEVSIRRFRNVFQSGVGVFYVTADDLVLPTTALAAYGFFRVDAFQWKIPRIGLFIGLQPGFDFYFRRDESGAQVTDSTLAITLHSAMARAHSRQSVLDDPR